jgi:hypothetical protein
VLFGGIKRALGGGFGLGRKSEALGLTWACTRGAVSPSVVLLLRTVVSLRVGLLLSPLASEPPSLLWNAGKTLVMCGGVLMSGEPCKRRRTVAEGCTNVLKMCGSCCQGVPLDTNYRRGASDVFFKEPHYPFPGPRVLSEQLFVDVPTLHPCVVEVCYAHSEHSNGAELCGELYVQVPPSRGTRVNATRDDTEEPPQAQGT